MFKGLFGLISDTAWNNGLILSEGMLVPIYMYLLMYLGVAVLAYFCGSINTAVIVSKLMYKEDIRTKGSGNAGTTNVMRNYGKGPALMTLLGDMFKTLIGMFAGTCILGLNGAYVAGLFCVVGHIFPIFHHFKGGKGVATTGMVLLYINPIVFLIMFVIFVGIVWATKYISLASVMGELIFPLILTRCDLVKQDKFFRIIISLILGLLVVYMHRSNIKRILEGTENKFSFKKTKKPAAKTNIHAVDETEEIPDLEPCKIEQDDEFTEKEEDKSEEEFDYTKDKYFKKEKTENKKKKTSKK